MNFGVIQFPGSNCDQDAYHALADVFGQSTRHIWHKDATLGDVDCVVVPGGFSYGDYLRTGAIARFAPAMKAVMDHAKAGGLVLGICNGFQVLCEAHLLPGALVRNDKQKFVCRDQLLEVVSSKTSWTGALTEGAQLTIPLKNGEGGYIADEKTLDELEATGRVVVRYVGANPNGSY